MYGLTEAFRSTYLDPAEVDRRPDSIGKAIPNAEILVVRPDGSTLRSGRGGRLVHRGASLRWVTGMTRSARRNASGRFPAATSLAHAGARGLVGDTVVADDEGFLYFIGRRDEMIKTSGYRVSPTEVEEVAYATGLDARRGGARRGGRALGQRILLVVAPDVRNSTPTRCLRMKSRLPLYMVPQLSRRSGCVAAQSKRQVRPGIVARGVRDVSPRRMIAAFGSIDGQLAVGGIPLERLTAAGRVHALLRLRSPTAHRARRSAAGHAAADSQVQLRREGQPHAGRRSPPRGLGRRHDVASTLEMQIALDSGCPPPE